MVITREAVEAVARNNGTRYTFGPIRTTIGKYMTNNYLFKFMSLSLLNKFCVALQDALSGSRYLW